MDILLPFLPENTCVLKEPEINQEAFAVDLQLHILLEGEGNYPDWIRNVVSQILSALNDNCYFACLRDLCKLQSDFCSFFFPLLVHDILAHASNSVTDILCQEVRKFFHTCFLIDRGN